MPPIVQGTIFENGDLDLAGLIPEKQEPPTPELPGPPRSELGIRIEHVREACGLVHAELARELSAELKTQVSAQVLSNWISGSEPRKLSAQDVQAALDRIEIRLKTDIGTTWIAKEEVARQVRSWLETLTVGQLARKLGVSPQLVSSWAKGHHDVLARRWADAMRKMGE